VAKGRIEMLPELVTNTYDEAVAVATYCQQHSVSRLTVVTSPYHTRRALAIVRSVIDRSTTQVGISPAAPESWAGPGRWWQHPYDRAYVLYELAALTWYVVRHGVNPVVGTRALVPHEGRPWPVSLELERS